MYTALAATSETLTDFLLTAFAADPALGALFGGGGTMTVSLNNPQEMSDEPLEGLSLWLYLVQRDGETLNQPPVRIDSSHMRNPPLPMRLHFLATPIVNRGATGSAQTEQIILGRTLQLLYDHPLFRGTDLRGDLQGTEAELRVRLEPMSLEEITRVWNALDRSYQLSVSYEVGIVDIMSTHVDAAGTVRETILRSGIMVTE